LPRQPRLDVELLRGRGAEIVDGDVHDAVGDPQRGHDLLLDRQQPLMLVGGLLRPHEREHLDLVELVDAEDPARVASGRPGLAAEAGREAGVAGRHVGVLDDLPHVERGERDL
jgi:hypothetical protein